MLFVAAMPPVPNAERKKHTANLTKEEQEKIKEKYILRKKNEQHLDWKTEGS